MGGGGKSNASKTPRLMGLDLTGAQYGNCIPVVFGQNKVPGNVIWYGDFKAVGHKEKAAGKGGGGKSNTTYTYTSSWQVGLGEGIASVLNVYDGTVVKSLAAAGGIGFTGSPTQAAWAHLSGLQALNYSGTSLACFQDYNLGSSASLPNLAFEVAARNQYGGGILDANPADIITAICTDAQIGITFSALGSVTQFKNYATAAGIFFSPVYDQQASAASVIEALCRFSNTACWFSEGQLKFTPYGDATITGNGVTFVPVLGSVADLTANDFITNGRGSPVSIRRKSPADAQNIVRLDYKDRSAKYRTITVQASIDQDMASNGARALMTESCDMIATGSTARLVVQNLLQRSYYVRNTYEFKLSWRWCHLEPMDIITLTDTNTGLNLSPVRILEIGEDDHGMLSVVAEEMPDGVGHASQYDIQAATAAGQDVNADPGPVTGPFVFRAPGFLVSVGAPQIWVAVDGANPLWGGCDVYISHDGGASYSFLNTHNGGATYGKLTNTMAVQADLDTVSAPNVVLNGSASLLGGSAADRDQFITMSVIDTEIVSYQTATLAAGPSYTLGSLRRGGYGTARAAHAVDAPFARLDANILKIPVDPSQIGNTIFLKFLSFNVFGLYGPRTLTTETAYSYVIGTCVEFPDVPVAPGSFAVTGVADGVNLKWTNANPASVDCTSIEFASAGSSGPWTVLAQVGPTGTGYHHAFTAGTTYWYRARSRGELLSGGWSAYTAVLSATGKNITADVTSANAAAAAAQTAANNAQTDATSALSGITNIGDDNLLTPGEKPLLIRDRDAITDATVGEQAGIDAKATTFGITTEKTTYDTAATAVTTYLATLTTPVLWSNLSGNTTVVGTTLRTKFLTYYNARQALLNAIYIAAKALADNAQTAANAAQTAANNAQTTATQATNDLTNIASDNILSAVEKKNVIADYNIIVAEKAGIDAQAAVYSIGSELTTFDTAYTALITTYLPTLTLPVAWNNQSNYTTINGVTFRGKFADYYNAKVVLLQKIADLTMYGVDYTSSENLLPNPKYLSNKIGTAVNTALLNGQACQDGWTVSNQGLATAEAQIYYDGTGVHLQINGTTSLANGAIREVRAVSGKIYVEKSKTYEFGLDVTAISFNGAPPGTINIVTQLTCRWYNAAGTSLSYVAAASVGRATASGYGTLVAPATAAYCVIETRGYILNSSGAAWTIGASGGTTAYNVRVSSAFMRKLDDLGVPGSGYQLGDLRNLTMVRVGSTGSRWSGAAITYSIPTTGSPAVVTLSVAAGSLVAGSATIAYNASSGTVNQTRSTTVTYYLYYQDASYTGGAKALNITTDPANISNADDRVWIGTADVVCPAAGTAGSGGGSGGGGCVDGAMWIDKSVQAEQVEPGDIIDIADNENPTGSVAVHEVTGNVLRIQPSWRIATEGGAEVIAGETTPMTLEDGSTVLIADMLGRMALTCKGGLLQWERVIACHFIGNRPVSHISVGGNSYFAGRDPSYRIATHNILKP